MLKTLVTVLNGKMESLWTTEKQNFLAINGKLSPQRAGELAAALLAKRFYDEGRAFEDRIFDAQTNPHAEPISDEEESLYDALNAKRCINRELESLSGSRTLLLDSDTVEQQRKEMVQEKLRTRGTVPASIIADYANDA